MKIAAVALNVVRLSWLQVEPLITVAIPPLSNAAHKGSMGRIGVLGGSMDYTGAPFYSAISSLKLGADLSWIFCSQSSAIPIKSYSPELMVKPIYDDKLLSSSDEQLENEAILSADKIVETFNRLHSLVIGPGLGRHPQVAAVVHNVIIRAREKEIPLVIDGDGLFYVTQNLTAIIGHPRCILTPNKREFEQLVQVAVQHCHSLLHRRSTPEQLYYQRILEELQLEEEEDSRTCVSSAGMVEAAARRVQALSAVLGGVTVLRKGEHDIVASSEGTGLRQYVNLSATLSSERAHAGSAVAAETGREDTVFVVEAQGSPRRCGGLGDVLSGITAVALHWALQRMHLLHDANRLTTTAATATIVASAGGPPQQDLNTQSTDPDAAPPTNNNSKRTHNACVHACILASVVAKHASELAFASKGRSMTAPDVIDQIGAAFRAVYPEG